MDSALPQIMRANVLLDPAEGVYQDMAKKQGLDVSGGFCDTKIADFGNEGCDRTETAIRGGWTRAGNMA